VSRHRLAAGSNAPRQFDAAGSRCRRIDLLDALGVARVAAFEHQGGFR
jgi:hypothetical protein